MMRYTLRQLEVFVDAAADCCFAKAADRLGISQPAVSDHLRALERNLGSALFERRRGRTAVLTPAGERLRTEARAVLEQGARLSTRAVETGRTVTVRLFAGPHIVDRMLRAALPAFHRAHPGVGLAIASELPREELGQLLDRRELDIAVFTGSAATLPPHAEILGDAPCFVVASRRLVGDAELTPEEVGKVPFVLPLEDAPSGRWIAAALAAMGIAPSTVVGRTQFLDVQQQMVESGEAAALLFGEMVESSAVRSELRRLSPDAIGLKRVLLTRRGEQRPEVQAVAAFLRRAIVC